MWRYWHCKGSLSIVAVPSLLLKIRMLEPTKAGIKNPSRYKTSFLCVLMISTRSPWRIPPLFMNFIFFLLDLSSGELSDTKLDRKRMRMSWGCQILYAL